MGSSSPFYCPDLDGFELGSYSPSNADSVSLFSVDLDCPAQRPTDVSEVELMTERFARLLLGEDMSGGRKGVCTALAISNDIADLSATVFGKLWKLEPLEAEKKIMWCREMDWILCVTDFIIELIPSVQESPDDGKFEVMMTRPRHDLYVNLPALKKLDAILLNILDEFGDSEFSYVTRGANDDNEASLQPSSSGRRSIRLEEKWWLPFPKLPPHGLSEIARKRLRQCRSHVNQIHKASSAINNAVLAEMEIPDTYLDSLPKNEKNFLGEVIYHNLTDDGFSLQSFLDYYLDKTSEHAILEVANRIEVAIHIWRQKCHRHGVRVKNAKPSWGGMVKGLVKDSCKYRSVVNGIAHDFHKYELLAQRAEAVLQDLRIQFPDLPHTNLDRSKIQHNKDVGRAILEGYSRALEGLSFNLIALIDDLVHVDDATKNHTLMKEHHNDWRRSDITIPKNKPLSRSYFWSTETSANNVQVLQL